MEHSISVPAIKARVYRKIVPPSFQIAITRQSKETADRKQVPNHITPKTRYSGQSSKVQVGDFLTLTNRGKKAFTQKKKNSHVVTIHDHCCSHYCLLPKCCHQFPALRSAHDARKLSDDVASVFDKLCLRESELRLLFKQLIIYLMII